MSAQTHFREVTRENLYDVLALKVTPAQKRFVASVAKSIAEAHYYPSAWFRAVYVEETPVGFVLLNDDRQMEGEERGDGMYLWRFLVDHRFQGKGYGRQTLEMVIAHCRALGAPTLTLSCVPEPGSAEPFYERFGFVRTGEMDDDEVVMRLVLDEKSEGVLL